MQESPEAAVHAGSVVGRIGRQAGRPVFEAVAVAEGVGGLADEALLGGAVEGAHGDGDSTDALTGDTQLECFSAGEAHLSGGVAVVAVIGAPGCSYQQPQQAQNSYNLAEVLHR